MKLIYNLLNDGYELSRENLNFLVIENVKEFRNISNDLLVGRTQITFFEDLEEIKDIDVIVSPLIIDFNDKKILNKILSELQGYAEDEINYLDYLEINGSNIRFLNNIIFQSDFPIEIDLTPDIKTLFKAYGFHIKTYYESDIEKLVDYLELVIMCFKYKIIITYNLMLYFSEEDIKYIYDFIERHDIIILDLETRDFILNLPHKKLLFDNDLCRVF